MRTKDRCKILKCSAVCAALFFILSLSMHGQTLEVLHSFDDTNDGRFPISLIQADDGSFYGTVQSGRTNSCAGIFRITADGAFQTIGCRQVGGPSYGGLTQAPDGSFYGTAYYGSPDTNDFFSGGSIFRLSSDGVLTHLFWFGSDYIGDPYSPASHGRYPHGRLVFGRDGALYGTTEEGGTNSVYGYGTVFTITTNGEFKSLVSFNGLNGAYPECGLTVGTDGNFYGTTAWGGAYGDGTVFKITPEGQLTTLHSFNGTNGYDGYYVSAPLLLASDGNFYGTTSCGYYSDFPPPDLGTVFRITPEGQFTTLYTSDTARIAFPNKLIQASDGYFYFYQSYYPASLCRLGLDGTLTTFFEFGEPGGSVIEASDGNFYGVGGSGVSGYGMVFRIIIPKKLNFSFSGNRIILSWPTNAIGFKLQSTADLNSTNWIDCSDSPATVGAQYVITNSAPAGNRFYRLKK